MSMDGVAFLVGHFRVYALMPDGRIVPMATTGEAYIQMMMAHLCGTPKGVLYGAGSGEKRR